MKDATDLKRTEFLFHSDLASDDYKKAGKPHSAADAGASFEVQLGEQALPSLLPFPVPP